MGSKVFFGHGALNGTQPVDCVRERGSIYSLILLTLLLLATPGCGEKIEYDVILEEPDLDSLTVRPAPWKCCTVDKASSASGIRRGDRILSIGDIDVRGFEKRSDFQRELALQKHLRNGVVPITFERDERAKKGLFFGNSAFDAPTGAPALLQEASCYLSRPRNEACDSFTYHRFACKPIAGSLLIPDTPLAYPVALSPGQEFEGTSDGCERLPGEILKGAAVFVSARGGRCSLEQKVLLANDAGAKAVILVSKLRNEEGSGVARLGYSPSGACSALPVLLVSEATGSKLLSILLSDPQGCTVFAFHGRQVEERIAPLGAANFSEMGLKFLTGRSSNLRGEFSSGSLEISMGSPGLSAQKMEDTYLEISTDLEYAVSGLNTTILVDRQIICPTCEGRGAHDKDLERCSQCSGQPPPSGTVRYTSMLGTGVKVETVTTCPKCEGFGRVLRRGSRPCKKCLGKRVIMEKDREVEVHIPPGALEGHTIVLPGGGNQSPNQPPGRLIINCHFRPHKNFTRGGDGSLHTHVNITLQEALLGFQREVVHLNGSVIFVNHMGVTQHGEEVTVPGGGLPLLRSTPTEDCVDDKEGNFSSDCDDSSKIHERDEDNLPFGPLLINIEIQFPTQRSKRATGESYIEADADDEKFENWENMEL